MRPQVGVAFVAAAGDPDDRQIQDRSALAGTGHRGAARGDRDVPCLPLPLREHNLAATHVKRFTVATNDTVFDRLARCAYRMLAGNGLHTVRTCDGVDLDYTRTVLDFKTIRCHLRFGW